VSTHKAHADYRRKALHLVLLRILSEQPGRQSNSSELHAGLFFLHLVYEEHEVIAGLQFLQLHQLIELTQLGEVRPNLYGAKLLRRGMDVVKGYLHVDGILDAVGRE